MRRELTRNEYFILFNAITDAVDALNSVTELLKNAQQQAEDAYIDACDDNPKHLDTVK